ncbi:MAG: hypothetical protein ACKOIZ_03200 [Actinomycetota bacterium]
MGNRAACGQSLRGVHAQLVALVVARLPQCPRAALLWEVEGPPGLQLSAPAVDAAFRTSTAQGEALLQVTK